MEAPLPSVERVSPTELPSGKALVTIDDGEEMIFDGIVWKLLVVLTLDPSDDPGPFVDFKTRPEVRRHLEKKMVRKVTERSIKQNILRLRNALAAHGYSRDLVEHEKGRGYRFRLLRPAPPRS